MKAVNISLFSLTLPGAVTILGLSVAASENAVTIIKLHQSLPQLTTVDSGQKGRSPGDVLAFKADLQGNDGLTAKLYGFNSIMDVAVGSKKIEDRVVHIVVDFGNNSTIIVAGRSTYQPDALEIKDGLPQPRPIIGGTGRFIGARGQVMTVRNPDGSYEHSIELIQ
jgi:hypothetical protein